MPRLLARISIALTLALAAGGQAAEVAVAEGGPPPSPQQILLANGAALVGSAKVAEDKTSVTVATEDGIVVELPRGDYRAAVDTNPNVAVYLKNAAKITDTPEGHGKIVEWAKRIGLRDVAVAHYQRIVELRPDDRAAWAYLDYQETSDGWVPRDRYWRSKGMVRDGGKWRIPQDVAVAELADQRKRSSYELGRLVSGAIRDLKSGGSKYATARQTLLSLEDPAAIPPLLEAIGEARDNEELRELLIDSLMAIPSPAVTTAIVGVLVAEPNASIRHRCIDYLAARPHEAALQKLQGYLINDDPLKNRPETIDNAAEAVAVLGDIRSVPRLMEVLITKHRYKVSQGGSTNGSFRSDGGISFNPSGKERLVDRESKNASVLFALQSITGQNLQYEPDRWRDWYARAMADTSLELRRDP